MCNFKKLKQQDPCINMKEDSLSEEKKTERCGDGAHFLFEVFWKHICLIVPRSILGQDFRYVYHYRKSLNRKSMLLSIVNYLLPLKLAALGCSSKLLKDCTWDEETQRRSHTYKHVNGTNSAGFRTFGEGFIMLWDIYHNTFKRLDISTECDLQPYNKIGEQVAKTRSPSKY